MNERERQGPPEERLPYSPPEIVFESHVEALAAACNPPPSNTTCPNKDTAGTTCGGTPPGNCSALRS